MPTYSSLVPRCPPDAEVSRAICGPLCARTADTLTETNAGIKAARAGEDACGPKCLVVISCEIRFLKLA